MRCVQQKHCDLAHLAIFTTANIYKSNAIRDFLPQGSSFLIWNIPYSKEMDGMMLGWKGAWTERLQLLAKQNIEPSLSDTWVCSCLCPVWALKQLEDVHIL